MSSLAYIEEDSVPVPIRDTLYVRVQLLRAPDLACLCQDISTTPSADRECIRQCVSLSLSPTHSLTH